MFQPQIIIPRWYQLEAIDSIYNYFMNKSGNPLIGLPGGTGKSIIPAIFIHKVMQQWPDQRFLLLTTVKELIEQNAEKMKLVWPSSPLGIFSAGLNLKQTAHSIIYGTVQSMVKNPAAFGKRDIIFIDEAHLVSQDESSQYLTFIATMKLLNPYVKIVGMTATPYRMGQGKLVENDGLFTDMCFDMTDLEGFNKLLAEGWMVPLVPKRTRMELDISEVGIAKGEFISSQLQKAVDVESITYNALRETCEAGQDRHSWLIFASGIEHSEHIANQLNAFGVDCAAVHSKKSKDFNNQAIRAFKEGRLRSISNFGKLTTGFDNPMIDLICDLRPTASIPLHVQKYCRGTRPCKETNKKNCLVLDFARNTPRLGCINDPIIPRKKGEGTGDLPIKLCDNCGAYNHPRVQYCDNCGHEFQFKIKLVPTSGNDVILRDELPVVEMFDVDRVVYNRYYPKSGNAPCIKATYSCGLRSFSEYKFPEGKAYVKHIFHQWWKERSNVEPPLTTDDTLQYLSSLRCPVRIRVWVNKAHAEIVGVEF